jgi:sporulation protein YlmC with PRC-barrel domain
MLRSLKAIEGYAVGADDGDIGKVVNFFLDDERWTIRYLVVETGGPLTWDGRLVLISPISFRQVDWLTRRFHLALTIEWVKNSPSVEMDKPVSRQHEADYTRHYGHMRYWGYPGIWGVGGHPGLLAVGGVDEIPEQQTEKPTGDIHLRSAKEIRGYHIHGSDGEIGHVEDFIVDDETWEVRFLVVNTGNWWLGKEVLIAPHWASRVSWEDGTVFVELSRQAIKDSPEWNPTQGVNKEYETRLYDYYGRAVDWSGSGSAYPKYAPPPKR